MAKSSGFMKRFPHAGIFFVIAVAFAIPLTTWSLNNVSTQTEQHATMPSYYYSQYSSAWNTSTCNTTKYGCFPTSLAMALKKYISSDYTPYKVARGIGSGCASGTNLSEQDTAIKGYARNNGLTTTVLRGDDLTKNIVKYGSKSFNYSLAKTYINLGYVLILSGCMKYYNKDDTKSSSPLAHAIVVTDVNTSTHVLTTLDPTKEKSIRYFDEDTEILDCPGVVNGWVSAYAVKKIPPTSDPCPSGKTCPL
jgi:hypothetical protein